MAVTLNASTSSGFIATSDTSGVLELQNNGTTRMTVNSSGVSFAAQPLIGGVAPPAFSAFQSSAQTALSSNTWTKIQFQTEEFDTNNNFDSTTNYRFTPTVAGYYQFTGCIAMAAATSSGWTAFYKNGSVFKYGAQISTTAGGAFASTALIYCNGSTDYVEFYGYIGSSQQLNTGASNTYFQGVLVRGA